VIVLRKSCARWTLVIVAAITATATSSIVLAQVVAEPTRKIALFDGRSLAGWTQLPAESWVVKDGAMASTGAGRGVIYGDDFERYRLLFTMRHVGAEQGRDHQACFLIFCTRPLDGEKALDALAGIQFQPPNGGHWDYRPGHNDSERQALRAACEARV
jgi:hypothetical protein